MIRKKAKQDVEIRENMRGGTGKIFVHHYLKPEEIKAKTRLCAELRIPSGASIGTHEHVDEDEIYLVQKGKGIITDNGQDIEIEAGDAILTGQGASHAVRNTGIEDLIITAVIIKY